MNPSRCCLPRQRRCLLCQRSGSSYPKNPITRLLNVSLSARLRPGEISATLMSPHSNYPKAIPVQPDERKTPVWTRILRPSPPSTLATSNVNCRARVAGSGGEIVNRALKVGKKPYPARPRIDSRSVFSASKMVVTPRKRCITMVPPCLCPDGAERQMTILPSGKWAIVEDFTRESSAFRRCRVCPDPGT